jgi:hypothetical protein
MARIFSRRNQPEESGAIDLVTTYIVSHGPRVVLALAAGCTTAYALHTVYDKPPVTTIAFFAGAIGIDLLRKLKVF